MEEGGASRMFIYMHILYTYAYAYPYKCMLVLTNRFFFSVYITQASSHRVCRACEIKSRSRIRSPQDVQSERDHDVAVVAHADREETLVAGVLLLSTGMGSPDMYIVGTIIIMHTEWNSSSRAHFPECVEL